MKKRQISVPAHDYQPTKAEMNAPICIDRGDLSADEAAHRIAQRLTEPADVVEVTAADLRKRRKQTVRTERRDGGR